ncbi:hypothetical protein [Arthrobacter sp. M2012083]|uniref:hypothetical protein n=1 Tax=Arthrobacter sp. M2012083 TaxID=1197706 RepID=UPI00037043AD|nr:hypothetical protein [Arthrobacter sp. M2012083]
MNNSLNPSTAVADTGQGTPRNLPPAGEALQPGSEHNTPAAEANNTNPPSELTPPSQMDQLRGLPSFGFEMVAEEPRTEATGC